MASNAPPASENTPASSLDTFNGFDTAVLGGLVDTLKEHPDGGRVTFFSSSRWENGARVSTHLSGYSIDGELHHQNEREHVVVSDEPVEFGAGDSAPAPPEELMAAMGSCIAATANAYGALKGIRLTRIEVDIESDVDLHGFAGLDAGVRPGLGDMRIAITIAGDADGEMLREIALLGYQFSLIRDTVQNSVRLKPDVQVAD